MLKGKTIIAERLRQLRGTSSLREMADAVGIKYSAWARYEAGGSLPGADILARICLVHACSADWILGIDELIKRGKSAAVTVNGNNNAVGANARVTIRGASAAPGEMPACSKCPYKKKWQKIESMK